VKWLAVRRLAGSAALVFVVTAIVVGNMPDSALKSTLDVVADPFRQFTGLFQDWSVYAPPREVSAYVEARVENTDGSSEVYSIPDRRGITAFADYRWQKYMEQIRLDTGRQFWPAFAQFIARRARADGRNPARVTLVRRWSQTLPPGPGPERMPWQESTFYVTDLGVSP
jgi:hypothetical protein